MSRVANYPIDVPKGVEVTLDALRLLRDSKTPLSQPIASAGLDTIFAPMRPRPFTDYWSSRAWVRELVDTEQWTWSASTPTEVSTLRLHLRSSYFEHLSDVFEHLAAGSLVVASPAAYDGLVPPDRIPELARLDPHAGPADLAEIERQAAFVADEAQGAIRLGPDGRLAGRERGGCGSGSRGRDGQVQDGRRRLVLARFHC